MQTLFHNYAVAAGGTGDVQRKELYVTVQAVSHRPAARLSVFSEFPLARVFTAHLFSVPAEPHEASSVGGSWLSCHSRLKQTHSLSCPSSIYLGNVCILFILYLEGSSPHDRAV